MNISSMRIEKITGTKIEIHVKDQDDYHILTSFDVFTGPMGASIDLENANVSNLPLYKKKGSWL